MNEQAARALRIYMEQLSQDLQAYRHDSVFTQSPLNAGKSPWGNDNKTNLLHRETAHTAFQYPFALNLNDCECRYEACGHKGVETSNARLCKRDWTRTLLRAVGQLNDVAGNHARSYFEMAPASILVRMTDRLVCGYDSYGFRIGDDGKHSFPRVVHGICHGDSAKEADYPGGEFFLGGEIVKDMDDDTSKKLKERGVTLDRSPQRLLETVAERVFPSGY